MSNRFFRTELFNPGCWSMRFFCPLSGKARRYPNSGFIRPTFVILWLVTAPNVVLCLSRCSIVALVPWLPHVFPSYLFINSPCARVVFERSTDGEWHNPSGTSFDGRGGSLEQVAWVPTTHRQEKFSINNYLLKRIGVTIIYPKHLNRKIVALLSSHRSIRERRREREREREN